MREGGISGMRGQQVLCDVGKEGSHECGKAGHRREGGARAGRADRQSRDAGRPPDGSGLPAKPG